MHVKGYKKVSIHLRYCHSIIAELRTYRNKCFKNIGSIENNYNFDFKTNKQVCIMYTPYREINTTVCSVI